MTNARGEKSKCKFFSKSPGKIRMPSKLVDASRVVDSVLDVRQITTGTRCAR